MTSNIKQVSLPSRHLTGSTINHGMQMNKLEMIKCDWEANICDREGNMISTEIFQHLF
jgi:hypothetical protein